MEYGMDVKKNLKIKLKIQFKLKMFLFRKYVHGVVSTKSVVVYRLKNGNIVWGHTVAEDKPICPNSDINWKNMGLVDGWIMSLEYYPTNETVLERDNEFSDTEFDDVDIEDNLKGNKRENYKHYIDKRNLQKISKNKRKKYKNFKQNHQKRGPILI